MVQQEPDLRLVGFHTGILPPYLGEFRRIAIAFFLASAIGIPLGLFLGWSERFKQYVFPVFELLRPVPPLAWVPLAIVMFHGSETPVIFSDLPGVVLRHRAEHDARRPIDRRLLYSRGKLSRRQALADLPPRHHSAARCLIFLPGCRFGRRRWFSLVAGEMVSGQIRPRLCDQYVLHDGALPDDRHRHGDTGNRRLRHQRRESACSATT